MGKPDKHYSRDQRANHQDWNRVKSLHLTGSYYRSKCKLKRQPEEDSSLGMETTYSSE